LLVSENDAAADRRRGLVQHQRLLEPIGNIPPAEAEERYYAMPEQPAMAA